jgi:hypothetical protein
MVGEAGAMLGGTQGRRRQRSPASVLKEEEEASWAGKASWAERADKLAGLKSEEETFPK